MLAYRQENFGKPDNYILYNFLLTNQFDFNVADSSNYS